MCLFLETNVWICSSQKQLLVQNGHFAALINTLCPAHESAFLHVWCSWFGRRQLWLVIPLSHKQLEQILGNDPQNLLLSSAGDGQPGKNSHFTWCSCAGAAEPHNTRNKPLPGVSGDLRNWWSLQKALTALPVMQPRQGHAKKSILQRILRSLRSAASRLELKLCSGM